jgi:hypothetical protein
MLEKRCGSHNRIPEWPTLDSLVIRAKDAHIHDDDGFKVVLVLWEVGYPRFQFDPGSAGAFDTIPSIEEGKSCFGCNEAFR